MVSLRSALVLSLGAIAAAHESSAPFDHAFSYLPSFSWLNDAFDQNPLGGPAENSQFTSLSSFPGNASVEAQQWTFNPQCLPRAGKEPVCVFALHSFAKGRGISILTTPSHASAFLTQSIFKSGNTAFGSNVERTDMREERVIPGSGRGMVARKALFRGDSLYSATPIMLVHPEADELEDGMLASLLWEAARALPKATQPLFWDLAAHDGEVDAAIDRVSTNAFAFQFHNRIYSVVSPEIARLNHDCRPNGVYFFDAVTMTQYVHIVRPVAPGEQLTISYTDASDPWSERQQHLKKNWGFGCSCSACMQHPRLTHESDQRMQEMEVLSEILLEDNARNKPELSAQEAIDAAERLISLYELERYEAMMGESFVLLSIAHASAKNSEKAKQYGRRAHLSAMIEDGFYHEGLAGVRELAEEPQNHWSWGIRYKEEKPTVCQCEHSTITEEADLADITED